MAKNQYADAINTALAQLDTTNNEHWTDDGLPVTRVVQTLAKEPAIKRSDINEVAPQFSRTSASEPVEETGAGEAAEPVAAAEVEVEDEYGRDPNSKEVLQLAFDNAEQALAAANNARIAASRAVTDAQKARDKALTTLNAAFPPLSHSENIQQYIQNEQNERIRKAGLTLGPSQLDAAMSARRSRGWTRPKLGQTVAR